MADVTVENFAVKKWNKWSPYGFDDYTYDRIYFSFGVRESSAGFMLLGGLAAATRDKTSEILDTKTNTAIYTFPSDVGFMQVATNLLAVTWEKGWKIIDRTWKELLSGYSLIKSINSDSWCMNKDGTNAGCYLIGNHISWSSDILQINTDGTINTYAAGVVVDEVSLKWWVLALYSPREYNVDRKIIWYMYPDGYVSLIK